MNAKSLVARLTLSLSILLTSFLPPVPAQTAAPQAAPGVVRLAGLKKGVKVRRDGRGIPYVEAEDEDDLYFAQGYVTAGDRLWQMDLLRRTERGELAEVMGSAALEQDKQHRTLGLTQVVDAEVANASPLARVVLEAYALGVNAYIASLDSKTMPPEFQILQYKPK